MPATSASQWHIFSGVHLILLGVCGRYPWPLSQIPLETSTGTTEIVSFWANTKFCLHWKLWKNDPHGKLLLIYSLPCEMAFALHLPFSCPVVVPLCCPENLTDWFLDWYLVISALLDLDQKQLHKIAFAGCQTERKMGCKELKLVSLYWKSENVNRLNRGFT